MKIKSLLLGSAAALVAVSGVQAADLDPEPMEYVKVCNLWDDFGDAYFIPSKDICLKVGGRVRADFGFTEQDTLAAGTTAIGLTATDGDLVNSWLSRAYVRMESRSLTDFGTLRTYFEGQVTHSNDNDAALTANAAYIQWGGITFGKAATNFSANYGAGNLGAIVSGSPDGYADINQLAYSFSSDFGFSGAIAIEDARSRRGGVANIDVTAPTAWGSTIAITTPGVEEVVPDIVANVRVSQSWGSFDVAGAIHLTDESGTGATIDEVGYAVGADLIINLPMVSSGTSLGVGVAYSDGANAYTGTISRGLTTYDVVESDYVTDGTFAVYTTEEFHVNAGISHKFTPSVAVNLGGSWGYSENDAWVDFDYWGAHGTVTWTPASQFTVAAEVAYENVEVDSISSVAVPAGTSDDADAWSFVFRMQRDF